MLLITLLNAGGVPTFEVGDFKVSPIGFFLPKLEYDPDNGRTDFYMRFARLVLVSKTEDVQAIVQFHGDNWGKLGATPSVIIGRAYVNISRWPVQVRFGRYILPLNRECTPPSKWLFPELSPSTRWAKADGAAFLSEGLMLHGGAGRIYYALSVSDGLEAPELPNGALFLGRLNFTFTGKPEGIDRWTFYRFSDESLITAGLGLFYEPVSDSLSHTGIAFDAHAEVGKLGGTLLVGVGQSKYDTVSTTALDAGLEGFLFLGDLDEKAGPGFGLKLNYADPNRNVEDDESLELHLGGFWFFSGGAEKLGLYLSRSALLSDPDSQDLRVSLLYHLVI